mgnify:CR=1 FL=1
MKTIGTREERANSIMEAQNRNLQIFAGALESGSITQEKYEALVKATLEQAKAELAKLT